jgi:RNA polymerase sigma-70 factor, ECF subfamily
MNTESETVPIEELLAESEWLTRLAGGLCGSRGDGDDLVQESYRVAIERPPRVGGSVRGWLRRVTTNLFWERLRRERAEGDRQRRKSVPAAPATPDEIAARLELQREVARMVLGLPEPSRSVLLLRYWEGLPTAKIARRLGVPGGTVRSRLSRSLAHLRAELDAGSDGGRERWVTVLLPLAIARPGGRSALAGSLALAGVAHMGIKMKLVLAAALLAMLGAGAAVLYEGAPERPGPAPEIALLPPLPAPEQAGPPDVPTEHGNPPAPSEPPADPPAPPPDLDQNVTVSIDNGTLKDAGARITELTGIPVTVSPELLDGYCSVSAQDLPLRNLLALLAMMMRAEWRVEGGGIAILPRDQRPPSAPSQAEARITLPVLAPLRPLHALSGGDVVLHLEQSGAISVEVPPGSEPIPVGTHHALWLRLLAAGGTAESAVIRADRSAPAGALLDVMRALCDSRVRIGKVDLAVRQEDGGEAAVRLPILRPVPKVKGGRAAPRLVTFIPPDYGTNDRAELDRWCRFLHQINPEDARWCVLQLDGGVAVGETAEVVHRLRSRGIGVVFQGGGAWKKRGPIRFLCNPPVPPQMPVAEEGETCPELRELPDWAVLWSPSFTLQDGPPAPISDRLRQSGLREYHGGDRTERVVKRCLDRLVATQQTDGSLGSGAARARTTAAGALALLGRAAPGKGSYGLAAQRALAWLASRRESDGTFRGEDSADAAGDAALAAWAFVEAALWQPESWQSEARPALAAVGERWRSGEVQTTFSALPLCLAAVAGVEVDHEVLLAVRNRLDEPGGGPEELLARVWLGEDPRTSEEILAILETLRGGAEVSFSGERMGPALQALALFQVGGRDWTGFNSVMWAALLGDEAPSDEAKLDRIAWTAIALQAYYRYCPVTNYF